MATLGSQALTLRDTAEAARNKDGSLKANILDLVSEDNGVLDDTTFMRADDGDKLSTDFRNLNPHGTWVALNEGVPASKTGFSTAWDTCGRIKARIEIPMDTWNKTKDKEALWQMHVRAHREGLREDVATALFYANIANEPRKFNGLCDFYDKYGYAGATRKQFFYNVINGGESDVGTAGGTAGTLLNYVNASKPLRSIWLVGWGELATTCFYPEVSKYAGLTLEPMKEMQLQDANGNPIWAQTQEIIWEVGLAVRNFQKTGRICNVQLETAQSTADYAKSLIKHMRHLRGRVKDGGVRKAWYMTQDLWETVEDALFAMTQGNAIKYGDLQQSKPDALWGIPIHICDCLDTDEPLVTKAA
ncbi:MAG: hypothetical protein IKO01_09025 [Kiritimatiellae bacterium]|nr:hypothetical protein [Kiritimatiellia bacterium]